MREARTAIHRSLNHFRSDNKGHGGYSPTDTLIERMSFSSNWDGANISNYIAINDTVGPNGESFRVRGLAD